jgi:hypothetical protein
MARPGLHNHPKFRRLVQLLNEPVPHVHGYLECIWLCAYENGDAYIGDQIDVELAAQWTGEQGKLCEALLTCGGRRAGFIEATPGVKDSYQVHDLHHHAPDYVARRKSKEDERRKKKVCGRCGSLFHSTETHAKFCSDACRLANHRSENGIGNAQKRGETNSSVSETDGNEPPAPAPAPAPAFLPSGEGKSDSSKAEEHQKPKRTRHSYEAEFETWYQAYPYRAGKDKAARAYKSVVTRIAKAREIDDSAAIEWLLERTIAYANSPKGQDGVYAGYPASWLNAGNYNDDPAVWQQEGGRGQSKPPREITRPVKRHSNPQESSL